MHHRRRAHQRWLQPDPEFAKKESATALDAAEL
jgi:hypothetical protein